MTGGSVGVGIIGCGVIGARRAEVAAKTGRSPVVIVADPQTFRAKEVAAATGAAATDNAEEVLGHPDVQAVIVATTHNVLAPVTLAALNAGKHVLCEKPMALNSREAEAVVDAGRRGRRIVQVGFNHRRHPAIRRAHALVREGAIGELLFLRCRYGHGGRPGYEREWRMDPEVSGGGQLLDQGIHAIDLFRWFLGDLTVVSGVTANWVWHAPVEDNVFALFRSPQGQVANLHASWTQWKNLFSFEVFGDHGALVVEGLGRSYGTESLTVYRRQAGGPPAEERIEFPGPDVSWGLEWDEFLSAIESGSPPPANAEDGLAALRLVEAVYACAACSRVQAPQEGEA